MWGNSRGRLIAMINNIFGTILTVYLLMQFHTSLYAVFIILFTLSVSATQCKSRLRITTPVLVLNIGLTGLGLAAVAYLIYLWAINSELPADFYITPISLSLYSIVGLLNALIIYNLHYRHKASGHADKT